MIDTEALRAESQRLWNEGNRLLDISEDLDALIYTIESLDGGFVPEPEFVCDIDGREFQTQQGLSMHMTKAHNPKPSKLLN